MAIYCGIDLGARTSQLGVIDEDLAVLVDEKVRNELPEMVKRIEPYKGQLQIAVETTFNWYRLVDGLQEAGYDVRLAHALSRAADQRIKGQDGPARCVTGSSRDSVA